MLKLPILANSPLLVRNTMFNLTGQVLPMFVAIFAIPLLIKGLGADRFGILTLAWMVIGYFSLFDIGLGRALTKLVAEKRGTGQEHEIPSTVWTGLMLMLFLGLAGALFVSLLSPWLVRFALKIPVPLQQETLRAFYLMAVSIPFVISTAGLRGIMEAYQCFGRINIVRIFMGVFTFAGPLLVLPFNNSLVTVIAVLVAGRVVAWVVHVRLCLHAVPRLRREVSYKRELVFPLLESGGWMTVSNIVGPLMNNLDRFLISGMLSVTAVAYYATPYELVTRLLIIPGALVGVLFPAFASSFGQDHNHTASLYSKAVKYLLLVMFPIVLLIVTFASEGLNLWLGGEFSKNSARVLQWLALGVFMNSLSQVSFTLLQGIGYADFTGKFHLAQLPFSIIGIWWLITMYGIDGAAIAWTVRLALETIILFGVAKKVLVIDGRAIRRMAFALGIALIILIAGMQLTSILVKGGYVFLMLSAFMMVSWFMILAPAERTRFHEIFK